MPSTKATRHGNGAGWGGPAKGAGAPVRPPFEPGNPTRVTMTFAEARAMNGDKPSKHAMRKALDEQRAEEMRQLLYDIATKGEAEANRLNAATKLLDRIEGMPVAKQQIEVKRPIEEMTEAELASAIDLIRAAVAGSAEGAGGGGGKASGGKPH